MVLSELWLDTQLTEPDLRHIATQLRDSGLSVEALQAIWLYEVAPLLWLNHWQVAGVWDGFDPQWLLAGCRRNQRGGRWHRLKCHLLRHPMTYGCRAEWQQVLAYWAQLATAERV